MCIPKHDFMFKFAATENHRDYVDLQWVNKYYKKREILFHLEVLNDRMSGGGGGNHDDPMFFLASKDNHCSWTASLVNMMWLFLYTGVILNVQIFASSSLHGFEAEIGRLNHISGWMTTIGNHTNEHEWIEVHSYQHVTVFILLHWSCNLTERKLT